jgi:hypothetical protein
MASFKGTMTNNIGELIPPTVFPHGPQWEGKITPYTPAYHTPHSPGKQPPPMSLGTLRRSTIFKTEPEPIPSEPFGDRIELTFEIRGHSKKMIPSGQTVRVSVGNHTPVGRILDQVVSKAFKATGVLPGNTQRIVGVYGPSGKQVQVGSGLTLYDQSPRIKPGSTMVLVFQD